MVQVIDGKFALKLCFVTMGVERFFRGGGQKFIFAGGS